MNWLASIRLDYELVARRRLNDSYNWHKAAWDAFQGMEKAKNGTSGQTDSENRTPFLSRVIKKTDMVELLILSRTKAEKPKWCPENCWRISEIQPSFLSYNQYLFDLYANPTRKIKKQNSGGEFTKNGKRLTILKSKEQMKWLQRKAEENGFKLCHQLNTEILPGDFHSFIKNGKKGLHIGVQFKGLLEVCDRQLFENAFIQGIGSAKGFGFGMLMIKPISI
ncbi:MAG: type I-E CRISPR-associated protein Cas6/Cse3/CasE [Desulfobacula sp.]|jgi:CRISPR system Cascade subunit CasE